MQIALKSILMVAGGALAGIGVYMVFGAFFVLEKLLYEQQRFTVLEIADKIPRVVRKIGLISLLIFLSCVVLGFGLNWTGHLLK